MEEGEMLLLDTHAVVFLHAGRTELFDAPGLHLLEAEQLCVSPAVLLELQYLYEFERIRYGAREIIDDLSASLSLETLDRNWKEVAYAALDLAWTRDPFDRMIAAQAAVEDLPLLTRDRLIRKNLESAPDRGDGIGLKHIRSGY
ncbi:MAG: type II toxin-antitoxin system VapC family toxin [Spirochaetia bacterium]